jgi:nucleoredoxin
MKKLIKFILSGALMAICVFSAFASENDDNLAILKKTFAVCSDSSGKRLNLNLADKEYVFIYYFSASSPACKTFTPELMKFYKENKDKASFEIIFVCFEQPGNDEQEQKVSMSTPFPYVESKEVSRSGILKFMGVDLPSLVLFDKKGNVLADCYEGKSYMGPVKVFDKFKEIMSNVGYD